MATPAAAQGGPNLLDNPDFGWPEQKNPDVCAPGWIKHNAVTPRAWTAYWACKSGNEVNQDQVNREPEFRPMNADVSEQRVRVRSYPTSASFFNFYSLNRSAGLVQQVRNVAPGSRLRFSIWAQLWSTNADGADSSTQPGGLQARACIDTTGATVAQPDFNSPNIVCGGATRDYDKFVQISVEATAASNQVTVIFDTSADYPVKHNDVFADDAELIVIGASAAPPPAAVAPAAPVPAAPAAVSATQPAVSIKSPTANVRSAPSFTANILASEPQGSTYAALAVTQDREWFQIRYKSGTAFIHNSVVTPNAAAAAALGTTSAAAASAPAAVAPAAPAPTAPQPAAPVPAVNPLESLPTLPSAPPAPAATQAPAAPQAPATTQAASATANTGRNRLLVRAKPSTTSAIVARAANGTPFKVLGVSPDKTFWRVAYPSAPGGEAWIMVQWTTSNDAAKALLR